VIATAPVRHYATIDSTNTEARRLYEAGERGPLLLLADEQRAGRGRMHRVWVSDVGNCYSTLLLPLQADLTVLPQIGFVTALAVADVASTFAPQADVKLKWPNDVLIGGAKVSGILSEVISQSPLIVAIGCGINVAHAPEGLAYPVTHLCAFGDATRDQVFAGYRSSLAHWLAMWDEGNDFETIRLAWTQRAVGIGETVSMHVADMTITGRFVGLSAQGAIIIKDQDRTHTLFSGDLTIPSLSALRNAS
jgi:BirA family transcriptional regulator, biotin operon repressor / biotin---[acetyl-CoA-carboxylase] ligase